MLLKGYIEGYYGRLLSWRERVELVKALGEAKADFYIYGPKEDPLHRLHWMDLYSPEQENEFKIFRESAIKNNIKPYIALSPGLSYEVESSSFTEALFKKLGQFQEIGFKNFAIFFDDIELVKDAALGELHGNLIFQVRDFLKNDEPNSLLFCPSVYCNKFAMGPLQESEYLKGLSLSIPSTIPVFWTGKEVVSEEISNSDLEDLKRILPNPILVWDNYYANDYCPTRFFVGPYLGRSFTEENAIGCGINPTGLPLTDSFLYKQMTQSCSTEELFKQFQVPDIFLRVLPFFSSPFTKDISEDHYKSLGDVAEVAKALCVDWKSPLQLEWAPFLWSFFNDIEFKNKSKVKGKQKSLEGWASQRYSDPLNKIINKKEEI
tara:strand:- start:4499 stop:5629 length:1131 start_codon:yes stop_codon:yes gene_type:complete